MLPRQARLVLIRASGGGGDGGATGQVKRPEARKSDEEVELEQKLKFEAYRDLISLLKRVEALPQ